MPSALVDLRVEPVDDVLTHVERALQVSLDREAVVRKRRSIGAPTSRNTWVRIERRTTDRIDGQGWNGTETSAVLAEVARPAWYAGAAWRDPSAPAMWRADETELITAKPVKPGGVLTEAPDLADSWWGALNVSLDALASYSTSRIATPDTVPIERSGVWATIRRAFPDSSLDITFDAWTPAHADLNWANLTGPKECWLLDWEDWGMAPRGLDAASLWGASLAVPDLADRVWRERRSDLECRTGRIMCLFVCAKILDYGDDDPRAEPARRESSGLLLDIYGR
ncbi:hypothetical protein ACH427_21405 [Streptomyces sp. NPDC020379]|uniref:hypothetical protein n=1 Tax=Streptomyces sp. NPDC020379 TaxID=3365071 RepID=UPI0037B681A9